jgi:hypothetical protein
VAARARPDVVGYEDDAVGEMSDDPPSPGAPDEDRPRPRITCGGPVKEAGVRHLAEVAHHERCVANSLRCEVEVEPTFPTSTDGQC